MELNFIKSIILLVLINSLVSLNLDCEIKFCAVGDVLLDRSVKQSIIKFGADYAYENVSPVIKKSDFALCNFEAPSSNDSSKKINKKFSFNVNPDYLTYLRKAGFNLANLANNHSIDMGRDGLINTISNLQNAGITPFGAGINQDSASLPIIIEKDNIKIAVFGYLEFMLEGIVYNKNKAFAAYGNFEKFCNEISKYRNLVNHIIVTIHWGREDVSIPNSRQTEMAHAFIDAGADLVIGHHPHVLQSVEKYKNRLILYSLGNFIFDNNTGPRSNSAIFSCTFNRDEIKDYKLIPINIHDNRPSIADNKISDSIFKKLKNISNNSGINLIKKKKYIEIGKINSINLPLKTIVINNFEIKIHSNKIIINKNGNKVREFSIIEKNMQIHDACYVNENDTVYIYAINGCKNEKYADRITIFPVDMKNQIFLKPFYDNHISNKPWKIIAKDIDGDNNPEIIVACWKTTKYFKTIENRILILNRSRSYLYTKWFGSKIGDPYIDFNISNDTNNKNLIFLQKSDSNYTINSFKWSGFGLEQENHIAQFNNIELARQFLYKY